MAKQRKTGHRPADERFSALEYQVIHHIANLAWEQASKCDGKPVTETPDAARELAADLVEAWREDVGNDFATLARQTSPEEVAERTFNVSTSGVGKIILTFTLSQANYLEWTIRTVGDAPMRMRDAEVLPSTQKRLLPHNNPANANDVTTRVEIVYDNGRGGTVWAQSDVARYVLQLEAVEGYPGFFFVTSVLDARAGLGRYPGDMSGGALMPHDPGYKIPDHVYAAAEAALERAVSGRTMRSVETTRFLSNPGDAAKLPDPVRDRVLRAIRTINEMNLQKAGMWRQGMGDRYDEDLDAQMAKAREEIALFRRVATRNGLDAEAVLVELGLKPSSSRPA